MPDHPGTPARVAQLPADLADLLSRALDAVKPDPGPTLAEALDLYHRSHVLRLKPTTRSNYESVTRQLRQTGLPGMRLGEIGIRDVLDAAASVSKGPAAESLLGRHVGRVFRWATRTGMWVGSNPAEAVAVYKSPIPNGELDVDELRALLVALDHPKSGQPWTRLALRYIALTGCRSGEALGLLLERVRPARDGGAWVDLQTKAGPQRRVISAAALEIVESCRDGRRTGVVFQRRCKLMSARSELRKTLARACVRANLRVRRVHDLRHTAASLLNAGGVAIADVAALLGHNSPRSTLRYLHGHRGNQRRGAETLGALLTADPGVAR